MLGARATRLLQPHIGSQGPELQPAQPQKSHPQGHGRPLREWLGAELRDSHHTPHTGGGRCFRPASLHVSGPPHPLANTNGSAEGRPNRWGPGPERPVLSDPHQVHWKVPGTALTTRKANTQRPEFSVHSAVAKGGSHRPPPTPGQSMSGPASPVGAMQLRDPALIKAKRHQGAAHTCLGTLMHRCKA